MAQNIFQSHQKIKNFERNIINNSMKETNLTPLIFFCKFKSQPLFYYKKTGRNIILKFLNDSNMNSKTKKFCDSYQNTWWTVYKNECTGAAAWEKRRINVYRFKLNYHLTTENMQHSIWKWWMLIVDFASTIESNKPTKCSRYTAEPKYLKHCRSLYERWNALKNPYEKRR